MSLVDALIEADLWTPPTVVAGSPRREIWICLRTDGGNQRVFGAGTQDNPYDGSRVFNPDGSTIEKFDEIMADSALVPKGATVRLGPGTFQTKGGPGGGSLNPGWAAKSGWRIVGSGMFVTTLKLVGASEQAVGYFVIGTLDFLEGFEVSDMTLDCNINGQPVPGGGKYGLRRADAAILGCCSAPFFIT